MISIIIPAFNEERRIEATLKDYLSEFKDAKIIVVADACTDRTCEIVKRFKKVCLITSPDNKGKGWSVKQGILAAKGDIICHTDADGSTSAKELRRLISFLDGYDAVIGSRWMKESVLRQKQSWKRRSASRLFNMFVRLLFGLRYADTQCGSKVYKRSAALSVFKELRSFGFIFDVEILYRMKRMGLKVREVPTVWDDAEGSRLSLRREVFKMFFDLVKLRMSL